MRVIDMQRSSASRLCARTSMVAVAGVMLLSTALAQYTFDPSAADEQEPGVRFFGSAKDDHGRLVPGATIIVSSDTSNFVFVTDDFGRFSGNLPPDTPIDKVATKCWKKGFRLVAVTKRRGPARVKPTVQVDCVLRSAPVAQH